MWFKQEKVEAKTDYFTKNWIDAWKKSISNSKYYKNAGKSWNAPLILKIEPKPKQIEDEKAVGIYMDLSYGECREMRYAYREDIESTDIILNSDSSTWIEMIEKRKDPTMAMLKGGIKVEKGSLVALSSQRKAATALLKTAPTIYNGIPVPSDKITKTESQSDPTHSSFTTTSRGLKLESFPMKLFQKANQFGIWDPVEIDLSKDRVQWKSFTPGEKRILSHLCSLFMAGEEAVTLDLLPLIQTIAKEGRIEEEIFLTSFLWEEAKHTEFFSLYVQTVMTDIQDFEQFHKPMYKILFYDKLPRALHSLHDDTSARAQLKAAATYNMIVEGTLAETGYAAFSKMLKENDLLPGLLDGIEKLKQDESRHIAFGLYLINRLLDDNPELGEAMEDLLEELLYDVTNIIHEIFSQYDTVPFDLKKDWFLNHAIQQFQNRIAKLNL